MQQEKDLIPMPEGEQANEAEDNEQRGFSDGEGNERSEPITGETNEREPAWRPGDEPAGEGVYDRAQGTSTGVEDEPEGPGI